MKKLYLFAGAAALMAGAAFTSCSHDFDDELPEGVSLVTEQYNRIFIETFGQPDPKQDWGFGETVTASSRMTREIVPNYDFSAAIPSKPTTSQMVAANFKENVNGIDAYTSINSGNGYARGVSYIDGNVTAINIWGAGTPENNYQDNSGGEVYFTGNVNLSGKSVSIAANTTIYIVKGAQVTLDNGFGANSTVYIAEGAKLTINNNISTGNVSYYIYKGSFEAKGQLVVNGGKEFFVENGTVKVGGEFQMDDATYYAKNTPITIGGRLNLILRNGQAKFYNEGGVITTTGELLNNSSLFYTDTNSSFAELSANGQCVNYNGANATMTFNGQIKVYNSNATATDGSVFINDGIVYGTYLGTEGGAFFENNGTAHISGNTIVNSNFNTWVNNGTYNTQYFKYTAGSTQVINNCRLNVSEDFDMNLGDTDRNAFRMDANSGVVTKNLNLGGVFDGFNGGPFYISMGSGSVFEVQQTATINATKADYGIYGPSTGEYAVLHANKIQCAAGQETQGYKVTYGGSKMAVVSETTHFEQGYSGQYPYIDFKEGCSIDNIYASNFHEGKPVVTIPSSTCNPGFSGDTPPVTPPTPPDTPPDTWGEWKCIIAEDLSVNQPSDFDFNDVVFDVRLNTNKQWAQIKLKAAGGTLPLTVGWDGTGSNYSEYEVHNMFGVATNVMVNTNWKTGVSKPAVVKNIKGTFNSYDDVKILVQKGGNWEEITAHTGQPASKILVKTTYKWCDEREDIGIKYNGKVYPYSFRDYVKSWDVGSGWYENP